MEGLNDELHVKLDPLFAHLGDGFHGQLGLANGAACQAHLSAMDPYSLCKVYRH